MTTTSNNPNIEILPEHIIDQIKAGEVLERPASLLKELIENSLDAGSSEINIHLIENGMDLLSIEDNGHGMNFKNLPYAFLRHATSKLKTFEDLYRLHSFGFRGEALASLAASARVTCVTQPGDLNASGGKIIINGGATELLIEQQAGTQGTSLFVKDLFFNTPARLKFIKSKVSEKSALKKIIYSFVLSHPHVTFTIKWDEKEKEIFKSVPTGQELERIAQVFFSRKTEISRVAFASQQYENYQVNVYFTRDTHTTPQYRHHYLFANKRFFQDKSLHQAVLRNLDAFWRFGESGHYVVDIKTPPGDIDVNVHPNKTQIKFIRSDVAYSLLTGALKSAVKSMVAQAPSFSNPPSESPSFFTKDENQSFDLMNFSGTESRIGQTNLFNRDALNLNQVNSPFRHIQDQFIIAELGGPFLIDLKKMLTSYISDELDGFSLSDESAGPLLISEPFKMLKGKIDSHFEELRSLGFEFDRLNNEYIVLRTIPKFLPQALLSCVAEALVKYLEFPKHQNFEKVSFKKFFEEQLQPQTLLDIPKGLVEKILAMEHDRHYMIELTNERLKGLFR